MNGWLLLQTMTGLFFMMTGYRKIFKPNVRQQLWGLFWRLNVPLPMRYAVIWGEFLGGISLFTGLLAAIATPLLLPIMFGAFFMDTIPTVREKKQPKELSQWVSNLLCTPEAQLIVILLSLTAAYWG